MLLHYFAIIALRDCWSVISNNVHALQICAIELGVVNASAIVLSVNGMFSHFTFLSFR